MITELRRYRIKPGRMASWLAFFQEAASQHDPYGIRVEYAGIDPETNTFTWLRSFADETDRVARKDAFYGADWWLEREGVRDGPRARIRRHVPRRGRHSRGRYGHSCPVAGKRRACRQPP
jgi:hypothetical protein